MRKLLTTNRRALALLPHRNYDEAQLIVAAGTRGSGKSELLKGYIEFREPRLLVLDQKLEYERVLFREDADDALDELAAGGPVRRRVTPPTRMGGREWAQHLFRRILEEEIEDFLLVPDELTRWTSNHATELLEALITQGRDIGVRVLSAVQELAMLPAVLQAEVTELVLFHQFRPADTERAESWAGKYLQGEHGPKTESVLRNLKRGDCLLMLEM